MAVVNPEERAITFVLPTASQYAEPNFSGFDGFVITGFSRRIASVSAINNTGMQLVLTNTASEVRVHLIGSYQANASFTLNFEFN